MSEPTHSIEQIRDGVQRLINSHFRQEPSARIHIPASRDDDDLMVSDAITELAALREWRAKAEPLLREIVDVQMVYEENLRRWRCPFCDALLNRDDVVLAIEDNPLWQSAQQQIPHAAKCPIPIARVLLGEEGQG